MTTAELALPILGAALTLVVAYASSTMSAQLSVGPLVIAAAFVLVVAGFVAYPHIAVAATIVLFALIPALKVLVLPEIGPAKDLVTLAAAVAAIIVVVFGGRSLDRWVVVFVLILLGIYVMNPGGGHDLAWAQALRLVAEPLLLLLAGLALPEPRRTLRWAMGALVATACLVATYGLAQQALGKFTLVEWGYSFDSQVRSLPGGQLRSFGTLDEPFAYAALLLFGLTAVVLWLRWGLLAWTTGSLIVLGLVVSFSRTGILIGVALAALMLARRGNTFPAVMAGVAAAIAGLVIMINASGSESRSYAVGATTQEGTANVVLNGRISAWTAAVGDDPGEWLLGRGVGEVGTGAERARYSFIPSEEAADREGSEAVDSGYLATIADTGFLGFVALLAVLVRLVMLAAAATRRGQVSGWIATGLLVVLLLDAVTRASFTAFPTAFLGLLLVGIAIAASAEENAADPPRVASAA